MLQYLPRRLPACEASSAHTGLGAVCPRRGMGPSQSADLWALGGSSLHYVASQGTHPTNQPRSVGFFLMGESDESGVGKSTIPNDQKSLLPPSKSQFPHHVWWVWWSMSMGEISRGAQGRATSGRLVLVWNYPPTSRFICLARRTAGEPQSRVPPPPRIKNITTFFPTQASSPPPPSRPCDAAVDANHSICTFYCSPHHMRRHAPTLISQPRIPPQPGTCVTLPPPPF